MIWIAQYLHNGEKSRAESLRGEYAYPLRQRNNTKTMRGGIFVFRHTGRTRWGLQLIQSSAMLVFRICHQIWRFPSKINISSHVSINRYMSPSELNTKVPDRVMNKTRPRMTHGPAGLLSLTVTFIDDDWKSRNRCLQTARLPSDNTGAMIAHWIRIRLLQVTLTLQGTCLGILVHTMNRDR